jgi:hypothetical protein
MERRDSMTTCEFCKEPVDSDCRRAECPYPKEKMRIQYSGLQYGKSLDQARILAERVLTFLKLGGVKTEIAVVPHEYVGELQQNLREVLAHSKCACWKCKLIADNIFQRS